jgi:CheY-like chemotaxis protein
MPKASVFIVEDDPIMARLIELRLLSMGYSICGFASDGSSAIEAIKTKSPDVALLDIGLKGDMDGINVAHVLSVESDVPYIFLTGNDSDDNIHRAKQTVPEGFIRKPFSDQDLKIAIELAVRE